MTIGVSLLNGLVGEWLFDNGTAMDTSGNGINGTAYGNAAEATDRFGNAGKAFAFDGDGDYIQAAADLLPAGERTVSLWFYANSIASGTGLMGYGGDTASGNNGYSYWEALDNHYTCYMAGAHGAGNEFYSMYSTDPIQRWHHYVVTTASGNSKMYLDGTRISTNNGSFSFPNTSVGGTSLFLGCWVNPSGTGPEPVSFNGRLDDVRIYDRALSADEIADLYHEGGWDTSPTGPGAMVGEWLFDGNANDTSGNGHDGAIGGGASLASDRFGASAKAYSFNGNSDATIAISGVPVDTSSGASTSVSFWMKRSGYPHQEMAIGWDQYDIEYMEWSGTPLFGFNTGNGEFLRQNLGINNAINTDQWYHVVAVFINGIPDSGNVKLFVDGEEQSLVLTNGTSVSRTVTPTFHISGWGKDSTFNFGGAIDDVRVYNKALTATEVGQLYHEGGWDTTLTGVGAVEAEWLFSGNANDGSLNARNATPANGAALAADRFGTPSSAYSLDGVDDYLSTPDFIKGWSKGSVALWFKSEGVNQGIDLFTTSAGLPGGNYDETFTMYTPGSGNLCVGIYSYASSKLESVDSGIIPVDRWNFAVATWEPGALKLYLNNALKGTYSLAVPVALNAAYDLIGSGTSGDNDFNGRIDDVRVWDRALTETEIGISTTREAGPRARLPRISISSDTTAGTNTGSRSPKPIGNPLRILAYRTADT